VLAGVLVLLYNAGALSAHSVLNASLQCSSSRPHEELQIPNPPSRSQVRSCASR